MALDFDAPSRLGRRPETSSAQGGNHVKFIYLQTFLRSNSKYESEGISSGVKHPSFPG
jgi:hypothetical protein